MAGLPRDAKSILKGQAPHPHRLDKAEEAATGIGGCTPSWSAAASGFGPELARELRLVACHRGRGALPRSGTVSRQPHGPGRAGLHRRRAGMQTRRRHHLHPHWAGWLYLATVIDCFNKEVIGYAMADHICAPAWSPTLAWRPETIGWPSTAFSIPTAARNTSRQNSPRNSPRCTCGNRWAARGCCYDNALAESFFATLKNERVHRTVYPTRTSQARYCPLY
jgi:transposase InsO family protein